MNLKLFFVFLSLSWTLTSSATRPDSINNTRVRDKKSLVKVGNLVKNSYLYR